MFLPGACLSRVISAATSPLDHVGVVPLRVLQRRRDDVLRHRVDLVGDGVAGARRPDRREAVVGAPAHQQRVAGQGQIRLDLAEALVAGTAERRPQVRPLDDAVEGDVGRVDDLAHGARGFHELVLADKIRSGALGEDQSAARGRRAGPADARFRGCAAPSDRGVDPRRDPRGTAAARHLAAAHARPRRRARGLARRRRGGLPAAHRRGLPDEPGGRIHAGRDRPRAARGSATARCRPRRRRIDFCPCRADGSQFPRAAWLRSLRRVLTERRRRGVRLRERPRRAGAAPGARGVPQSRARHVCAGPTTS